MMPILVKGDDIRSGRKAKARHGRHRNQCVNTTCKIHTKLHLAPKVLIFQEGEKYVYDTCCNQNHVHIGVKCIAHLGYAP